MRARVPAILINGCSSAGKTSIARALAERCEEPWAIASIDDFLRLLPDRLHDHPDGVFFERQPDGAMPLRLGESGRALIRAFHRSVRAMIDEGLGVIIDDVLFEPWIWDDWQEALAGCALLTVRVDCPLDELERRERRRGDRHIGQARAQFPLVHAYAAYDLTVDSGSETPEACAERIRQALAAR